MSEVEEEKTPLRVTVTLREDLREAFLIQRKKMALDAIKKNESLPSDSDVILELVKVAGCSLSIVESTEEAPGEGEVEEVPGEGAVEDEAVEEVAT